MDAGHPRGEGMLSSTRASMTVATVDAIVWRGASMGQEGMYGRPLVGKSFFGISAKESGAVMYAAFVRGR